MKLANNLLAATTLAATSEAVVMGVKAGSGSCSDDRGVQRRFGRDPRQSRQVPRAILPRSFDHGFATGLMVKDVRLCLRRPRPRDCH